MGNGSVFAYGTTSGSCGTVVVLFVKLDAMQYEEKCESHGKLYDFSLAYHYAQES